MYSLELKKDTLQAEQKKKKKEKESLMLQIVKGDLCGWIPQGFWKKKYIYRDMTVWCGSEISDCHLLYHPALNPGIMLSIVFIVKLPIRRAVCGVITHRCKLQIKLHDENTKLSTP